MNVKKRINDLAIFGGQSPFVQELHVGRPNIGDEGRLFERIKDSLDRKWLTNNGPFVQELEHNIAKLVGAKHCIATCNATIALEILAKAVGLLNEVIIPSFTFIATAHVLRWQGITPVFCDIDPNTHNIDPQKVESMVNARTTGIIGVHVWGQPCNVEALSELADRHNLKLLFDAAHAFGCSQNGIMVGNFGIAEVFSFHATKFLNTFEGGAVVTNDDELASKVRLMQNFGFAGYDNVVSVGTNGKMSEISAAMGLTSLECMDEFIAVNYRNYKCYQRELAGVPGITLLTYDESQKRNYQYIVLEVDESTSKISRDWLQQILWAENILARRYFFPGCHRMEPYSSDQSGNHQSLPETERLVQRTLVLPSGTAISEEAISQISGIIKFVIQNAPEICLEMARNGTSTK